MVLVPLDEDGAPVDLDRLPCGGLVDIGCPPGLRCILPQLRLDLDEARYAKLIPGVGLLETQITPQGHPSGTSSSSNILVLTVNNLMGLWPRLSVTAAHGSMPWGIQAMKTWELVN